MERTQLVHQHIQRRGFLLGLGGAIIALSSGEALAQEEKKDPPLIPPKPVVQTHILGSAGKMLSEEVRQKMLTDFNQQAHLLANNSDVLSVFTGIHKMEIPDIQESLLLYYPIYRFAEFISDVSWVDLAVGHAFETRFSQDPNPGLNGYVGAMQRGRILHSNDKVESAARGFGFLDTPNQRYRLPIWTEASTDYKEILWAGEHIAERARIFYPGLPFDQAVREVLLHNYSANGTPRVLQADRLKAFLR